MIVTTDSVRRPESFADVPKCGPLQISFRCLQFNFVGKLLGPKGNSMKRLQEETMTKMAVLGRGSMRDKQKVTIFKYRLYLPLGP